MKLYFLHILVLLLTQGFLQVEVEATCSAGYYDTQSINNCMSCPAGRWSTEGLQTVCTRCLPGK